MFETLIGPDALHALAQGRPDRKLVLDCSFDNTNPQRGLSSYQSAHIPNAFHIDLETQLSGQKTGLNGRHPLPALAGLARQIAELGAGNDTQIVTYDRSGGQYAARAWWLLRRLGHCLVAVLDGGLAGWEGAGFPLADTPPLRPSASGGFKLRPSLVYTMHREQLLDMLGNPELLLIDARSPNRFCGENETVDPVAGHIPGALNRHFHENLDSHGHFKPAVQLRTEFRALFGPLAETDAVVVNLCGSGVAACHNLLAMELAGIRGSALYPGSWSEWCAYPSMPLAVGRGNPCHRLPANPSYDVHG